MNVLKFLIATAFLASLTNAHAVEQRDTNVRAAAIKRMQSKLGELRGTIGLNSRFTRLTKQMIDQWKPVKSSKIETEDEPKLPGVNE